MAEERDAPDTLLASFVALKDGDLEPYEQMARHLGWMRISAVRIPCR